MAACARWYGPNRDGTALVSVAFSASGGLPLATSTGVPGQAEPGARHCHAAVVQPRQHVPRS